MLKKVHAIELSLSSISRLLAQLGLIDMMQFYGFFDRFATYPEVVPQAFEALLLKSRALQARPVANRRG